MEPNIISKLLNNLTVSNFMIRKWIQVNDLLNEPYYANKNILESPMLKSDLCNYTDAYIVVKGAIIVEGTNANNQIDKMLNFKNKNPFIWCISKIDNTLMDNPEDLDIVMAMYNLLQYTDNSSMTSESLWI